MAVPRARDGSGGTLFCASCEQELPVTMFRLTRSPYADGTPRYWSYCRECDRQKKREDNRLKSSSKLHSEIAPLSALHRLIDEHPEVRETIIKHHSWIYHETLEEERKRLLERRRIFLEGRTSNGSKRTGKAAV